MTQGGGEAGPKPAEAGQACSKKKKPRGGGKQQDIENNLEMTDGRKYDLS